MERGQPVKVKKIWAGCEPGHGKPLTHWFDGYIFERVEPSGSVLVKATRGVFSGSIVRFAAENVRPV